MAQTKAELVEELGSQASKSDLVDLLRSRLRKDDLVSLLEDESGATKEELLRKLGNKKKDELVEAVATHLTKDEIQEVVDRNNEENGDDDQRADSEREQQRSRRGGEQRGEWSEQRPQRDEGTDIDWSAELDWSPAPRPTSAPVTFVGAAPFQPGQRVRVDISGLPMMGIFAGKGASAAGTIVGVDARERSVRVYLDAVFDGEKEIVLPPERVLPDG
jgi:ribosomal protein L21E